ncbi:Nucleoside diphosphate kinase [Lachancea thermotolerans]|uniref:Nucleoside diphosphate kinase n=1 Tax=Lachancea thermotolerans (strain ATCC 56472 / CBS 6340 / NRRL Y-8284) TaxID=559295 RepID=C5DCL3_LACTC|nr:KLTH0B04004p [Lachancea thermotolerans CBS 6340]CAR21524.1 KLTH0B04004p [Lachancea thermotolerans CBS 6340]
MSSQTERTFIAIKPDGVQRGLVAKILARFEDRGFKLVAVKLLRPSQELLRQHYAEHVDKPFFPKMSAFMSSGPVLATVWEGKDAVRQGRVILGATNPLNSAPGTIRGDFAIDMGRNVCHGSDSVESAQREIALWFQPEELVEWTPAQAAWVYE